MIEFENFVNLTPHDCHYKTSTGEMVTFPRSGKVARVEQHDGPSFQYKGVTLCHPSYGAVQGLPDPDGKTVFIVSAMIRTALPNRLDIVSPGSLVRDSEGKIVGCETFHTNLVPGNPE